MTQSSYEQKLLSGWEDVFKKSQLTLWILLSLKDSPKHMAEIKRFIFDTTNGMLEADDKSMYRALRRYSDVEMVRFETLPSDSGPDRKVYSLTHIGGTVLDSFIERNIVGVFFSPTVKKLLQDSSA